MALLHTGDVVARSVIDLHYFPKIEPPEPIINIEKKVSSLLGVSSLVHHLNSLTASKKPEVDLKAGQVFEFVLVSNIRHCTNTIFMSPI